MKRVKTVSLIVASVLLLNTFSACSNKDEQESSAMTDVYTSYAADQTSEQTESTTAQNDELKWHSETITVKDNEGYIIDKTVTISDWISYNNNKDVLDQAWSEVGGGEELTSPGGLGFNDDASYSWFDENPLLDWNEVYYAVGTLELKNKTEGFDLSNYTMVMGLGSNSFEPTSRPPLKLKLFLSDPSYAKCLYNGTFYSQKLSTAPAALMKSNTWKVSFILAYAVNKTPNHPQGNPPAEDVGITLTGLVIGYGMYENKVEIKLDVYGESSTSSVTDQSDSTETQIVENDDYFLDLINMMKSVVDSDLDTAKATIQKQSKDFGNEGVPDRYLDPDSYTEKVNSISYNCKDIGAFVFETVDIDYIASNKRVVSVTFRMDNITRENAQMGYEYFASQLSALCGQPFRSDATDESDVVNYNGVYKTNDGYSFWVCYADWDGDGKFSYYITCYNINDGYHTDSFIE